MASRSDVAVRTLRRPELRGPHDDRSNRRLRSAIVAAIPALALTFGVPFANRVEPRILGLPFILGYIVAWIVLTPGFLYLVYRGERRE
jgi:hypothetical protein